MTLTAVSDYVVAVRWFPRGVGDSNVAPLVNRRFRMSAMEVPRLCYSLLML